MKIAKGWILEPRMLSGFDFLIVDFSTTAVSDIFDYKIEYKLILIDNELKKT